MSECSEVSREERQTISPDTCGHASSFQESNVPRVTAQGFTSEGKYDALPYGFLMNPPFDPLRSWRDPRSSVRVAIAALSGIVSGVVVSFWTFWQAAMLIGWDVGSLFLISWIWWAVWNLNAEECEKHANREDPGARLTELIVLSAGVAVLAAVGDALIRAGSATGGTKAYLIALGLVSVASSWGLVQTVFTLRYARSYYSRPVGGVDFNEDDPPTYPDFAYLGLTIGMTSQVSDTNLRTKRIRRIALSHALLSYLFGAVILALIINVVSSLLH
jgi:uncharacterized membrane protein